MRTAQRTATKVKNVLRPSVAVEVDSNSAVVSCTEMRLSDITDRRPLMTR